METFTSADLKAMRFLIGLTLLVVVGSIIAQPKTVSESIPVTSQTRLDLEFDFADQITFKSWDKEEVLVKVEVEINDGKDNDVFTLNSRSSATTIYIEMDEEMWEKIPKERNGKQCCNYSSRLDYTVYLPNEMAVKSSTINGTYEFQYYDQRMQLKTISGGIDITIPKTMGMDFNAKTITGEVYSDIEIKFPNGKEGLRQVVGQDFFGRIHGGGLKSELETISGNIYLRKG